jgi:copper(I)-binding protein
MRFVTRGFACTLLAWALLMPRLHAENAATEVVITQAWSRATPNGAKVAGGYLTIANKGAKPDRLLSGWSDFARKLEIHEMALHDGVMTMRPIEAGVTVEPGRSVTFAPGGYHLMFIELNAPLKQGERVPVTLQFEHAGAIKTLFEVQGLGAQAPAAGAGSQVAKAAAAPDVPAAEENFFTHLHAERAMANVTISPGRAGPIEIAIQLENADELPLSADAVSVTLGNAEEGVAPVTKDATRIGADRWTVSMSAPVAGRWSLGLGITISATDTLNVVSPILIR